VSGEKHFLMLHYYYYQESSINYEQNHNLRELDYRLIKHSWLSELKCQLTSE